MAELSERLKAQTKYSRIEIGDYVWRGLTRQRLWYQVETIYLKDAVLKPENRQGLYLVVNAKTLRTESGIQFYLGDRDDKRNKA